MAYQWSKLWQVHYLNLMSHYRLSEQHWKPWLHLVDLILVLSSSRREIWKKNLSLKQSRINLRIMCHKMESSSHVPGTCTSKKGVYNCRPVTWKLRIASKNGEEPREKTISKVYYKQTLKALHCITLGAIQLFIVMHAYNWIQLELQGLFKPTL